jgi:uncharacterized protein (DUF58 family)
MAVTFSQAGAIRDKSTLQAQAGRIAIMLPDLLAQAEQAANTLAQGLHGRRKSGPGEAFWQYRPFMPGDTASAIDWRKSGRSDNLFIRENEWEAAQTLWFWVDMSDSMQLHSSLAEQTKAERAIILSLALGFLLTGAGEMIGAYGSERPPGFTKRAVTSLAQCFFTQGARPASARAVLPRPANTAKPYSEAVFMSDFLGDINEIQSAFCAIAATGINGHMVQVLDPAEETLPFSGRIEFADPEGKASLTIARAENLKDRYQQRLHTHRAALKALARRLGWRFTTHHTDTPPGSALLALNNILAQNRT